MVTLWAYLVPDWLYNLRFHLRKYHHFQSLHRASNFLHRAPHNFNTCHLLSLFVKRLSFLTLISVYCTSGETNFRCERADSKLRIDHCQLCVIFAHMKFLAILHFFSTAGLLNTQISQSFLKTLMRGIKTTIFDSSLGQLSIR